MSPYATDRARRDFAELRAALRTAPPSRPEKFDFLRGILSATIPSLVSTLIPSLVLFLLGYWFLEEAKQSTEARKVAAENTKEIRDLVKELIRGDTDNDTAVASAVAIGSFGRYSVVPLVMALDAGGPNSVLAAQRGLIAAGLLDHKYTCEVLVDVLENRTRRHKAITHKEVIKSIADIGCVGQKGAYAEKALINYKALLSNSSALAEAVITENAPDNLANLKAEVDSALKKLGFVTR
jgi:hypothetical protein